MPRTNLVNYPGKLVIVSMAMEGVRGRDRMAKLVKETANFLGRRGIEASVVVPSSCTENFNAVTKGPLHIGKVDGIEVIAVDSQISSYYPEGQNSLAGVRNWANTIWQAIAAGELGKVGLIHGLDHPAGILIWEQTEALSQIRTVFTPMDPIRFDLIMPIASHDDFKRFGDPLHGSFHQGGISGFKAGVRAANIVTVWNIRQLNDLRNSELTTYAEFVKYMYAHEQYKFHLLGKDWSPESEGSLPRSYISGMITAYLRALYGTSYDFSATVGSLPLSDVNAALISTAEKNPEDPRSPILRERMQAAHPDIETIDTAVRYVARYPKEVYPGFRGNMGGIAQMLKTITEDPRFAQKDPQGNYFAFLNGGDGERGFVITLNANVKGELVLGERTIGAMSFDSAAMVARQLPAGDKGWVVIFGCDNYMVPNGPITIGDHLLSETKQGLVLLGLQEKVLGNTLDHINYLKDLGIFFVDPKSGDILSFREKMQDGNKNFDLNTATSMLMKFGGQNIYKNTFFFAMRLDVAEEFYKGFAHPSALDGKPLHETYDLDYSLHFTTPALMDNKESWMALYETKGKGFARADWECLFDHAKRIKELAGGIGGADIGGGEQTWSDIGTIGEYYSRLSQIISSDESIQRVARKMMGIPESFGENHSFLENVAFENGSHYVGRSVFKKGGKIGNNVIIIGSLFEEYVEIPDNTIIIGSHIYKIKFQPEDRSPKLLYGLYQNPHEPEFDVKSNCAHSSIFLINSQKVIGVFPINMTGKETERNPETGKSVIEPYLGRYAKDGKMVSQSIFGIGGLDDRRLVDRLQLFGTDPGSIGKPSVKNVKRINSLSFTDEHIRTLNELIGFWLMNHGIA